jgi:PadR family transcriptional regulator, regulatory protein PadR
LAGQSSDYLSYMRLVLGLYILKILRQGPAHGNKLAEEIKRRTQNTYTPNTNALYPLLRIMEEKNYVAGQWDSPVTRGKRVYTITEAGLARIPALEQMMEERLKQAEGKIAVLRSDLLGLRP